MGIWSNGASKLKRFEFRVPGYGLKHCGLTSAVHDRQLVTRNTQRKTLLFVFTKISCLQQKK
jgi:hypothetical protein